jgi:Protein of unknown function (DUF3105)
MSSRKEQKEALRRERLQREQEAKAAQRRKQLIGYGVGGALALAAVIIVAVLIAGGGGDSGGSQGEGDLYPSDQSIPDPGELSVDLRAAAREAGCELEEKRAPSREHTQDPDQKLKYNLNPPAAGRHYEIPAEDGIYNEQPPKEHLVHTEEHGRVIVWFKRSLPENARGQLKTLFEEDPVQLVLTPDDENNMPYDVAATAWGADPPELGTGYLMGCPNFNEQAFDALRAFIGEHRGNGPEPVP